MDNFKPVPKDDITVQNNGLVDASDVSLINLQHIRIPPIFKPRGRPRGTKKVNAIGLPKKRIQKRSSVPVQSAQIFSRKTELDQAKFILTCFVAKKVALAAMNNNYKIEEEDVETVPERVSNKIIHEDVKIEKFSNFFTQDA